ncbi:hypothetical protein C0J52_28066 [Blattella germanica]|nr:hypothetical protein C0J52_28066 [Blattella germanica]
MATDKIQPVLSPWPHTIQKLSKENIENTTNYPRTPPKRKGQEEERRKKTRNDRQNNDHANWVAHYNREKIVLETRESYTPKTRKIEQEYTLLTINTTARVADTAAAAAFPYTAAVPPLQLPPCRRSNCRSYAAATAAVPPLQQPPFRYYLFRRPFAASADFPQLQMQPFCRCEFAVLPVQLPQCSRCSCRRYTKQSPADNSSFRGCTPHMRVKRGHSGSANYQ